MNRTQKTVKLRKHNLKHLMTFMLFTVLQIIVVSCTSPIKQKEINATAQKIYQDLYVPDDAVLLSTVMQDDALRYNSGCIGTFIEIAFGVNRTLSDVMNDYEMALLNSGWEFHSGYTQRDDYRTYSKGITTTLAIGGDLTEITLPDAHSFSTVYGIDIIYTEPSDIECRN